MDAMLVNTDEQEVRTEGHDVMNELTELTMVELAYVGGGMANFSFA